MSIANNYYNKEVPYSQGLPLRSAKHYDLSKEKKRPIFSHITIPARFVDFNIKRFNYDINQNNVWYNHKSAIPSKIVSTPIRSQYLPTSILPIPPSETRKTHVVPQQINRKKDNEKYVEIYVNEPYRYETKLRTSMTTTKY